MGKLSKIRGTWAPNAAVDLPSIGFNCVIADLVREFRPFRDELRPIFDIQNLRHLILEVLQNAGR